MTDTLAPFGLRASRKKGGNPNANGVNRYRINPAGNAGNIFKGDPVKTLTTGYITQASATTDYVTGRFMGCMYNDSTTKRPTWSMYYPANTSVGTDPLGIVAFVADDVAETMVIQADASLSVGDIGLNFDVTVSAGSTFTYNSGFALKAASRKATTALLRVVDIFDSPDNALTGANGAFPLVEVKWVQHQDNLASIVG